MAITNVNPTSPLAPHCQPLDVLASVGEAAVDNDGTVAFRGGESINITYHISQFQVWGMGVPGETCPRLRVT